MKPLQKKSRKLMLEVEELAVDTFPTAPPLEIPQFAANSICNCTHCPSHIDSWCPCCTGPDFC